MVDRYKEINDQLEEITRRMKKATIAADGLWGDKRLAKLKENIKLMKQELKYLKEKEKMAKSYLKTDKQDLQKAAGVGSSQEAIDARNAFGMTLNFKFDENGYITNYTELMTNLYRKREALLKSFGAEMDEKEQKRLEEFDKAFENLKSSYEQYEKTLDERDDLEEERLQKILDI
jgi:predicted metal-dependent phosphoesterase TrpH